MKIDWSRKADWFDGDKSLNYVELFPMWSCTPTNQYRRYILPWDFNTFIWGKWV